jgi:hypothetical protein
MPYARDHLISRTMAILLELNEAHGPDETGTWAAEYFDSKKFNCHRRQRFFVAQDSNWSQKAPEDPHPQPPSKSGLRTGREAARLAIAAA